MPITEVITATCDRCNKSVMYRDVDWNDPTGPDPNNDFIISNDSSSVVCEDCGEKYGISRNDD